MNGISRWKVSLGGSMLSAFAVIVCLPFYSMAQTTGDEEKDMQNRAKARDQQAIEEAVNGLHAGGQSGSTTGWWTESMKNHEQRITWWRDAKFGMFVHWGIYSLPGGEWKGNKVSGYAEHLMRKEKILRADYLGIARQFNPVNFNAEEWIRTARNAGMRYFVITAKHHDGFAMYDSKVSDFNIIQQTPFGRDPMAELAAACKKFGVKFGFYYSHAFDWEHPDAPGNDWEHQNPGGDRNLYGGREWYDLHPELLPKAIKYVDEKAIPQIKELMVKYRPDLLWFDTPHKLPLSENIRILKAIRETDDNIVVNGRLARSETIPFGDYRNTADRPAEFYPVEGDWEAIPTTNESYGYHRYDSSHKSPAHFIHLLANAVSRGGNLLLNIGPKGDGRFDQNDMEILDGISQWMKVNEESIYGTTRSPLPLQSWGVSTQKNDRVYLHVFRWPSDRQLVVGGLKTTIKRAYLLADAARAELKTRRMNDLDIAILLPEKSADQHNTVIVVEPAEKIEADPVPVLSRTGFSQRLLAFDAVQTGSGFRFGDGKADRYFVEGWERTDQTLGWKFRVIEPMKCNVRIKYIASGGGELKINLNARTLFGHVSITDETGGRVVKDLGPLSLKPGTYTLSLIPASIRGKELMKLLELELVPTIE
jgi:alpha-L-fucosidase